ncbi:hypothetical protein MHB50_00475 [Siminovitchia sp. FSL H7-0308]|uniref:Uncharacterized protein n=1 Tax=Siminovitchia thermophila TaxID=1245522 RepID=A0ABS2R4Z8_9BACI|nr:hypothetical protein [Siminovitchia thermophila]ONK24999.1 hypothetical protein BLX87_02165 [Bacillus sp. VT-16-64]
MKFGVKVLGYSIAVAVSYYLYQSRLGAIPFLAASAVMFYLGYRLSSPIFKNEKTRPKEQPPETGK